MMHADHSWFPPHWVYEKNGDIYEGQKKDSLPHGYGTMITSSGLMHEGQVKKFDTK